MTDDPEPPLDDEFTTAVCDTENPAHFLVGDDEQPTDEPPPDEGNEPEPALDERTAPEPATHDTTKGL